MMKVFDGALKIWNRAQYLDAEDAIHSAREDAQLSKRFLGVFNTSYNWSV